MKIQHILSVALAVILASCSRVTLPDAPLKDGAIAIYPDYKGVTVPVNIAPMNFCLLDSADAIVQLACGDKGFCYQSDDGNFHFPESEWKELTSQRKDITVTVCKNVLSDSSEKSPELIGEAFTYMSAQIASTRMWSIDVSCLAIINGIRWVYINGRLRHLRKQLS